MGDLRYGVYSDGYHFIGVYTDTVAQTFDKINNKPCYIAYAEDFKDNGYWVVCDTPDMEYPYSIEKEGSGKCIPCNRHMRTDYDVMNNPHFKH